MSLIASDSNGSVDTTSVSVNLGDTTGATILVAVVGHFDPLVANTLVDFYLNAWISATPVAAANTRLRVMYCPNPITGPGHTVTVSGVGASYPSLAAIADDSLSNPVFDTEASDSASGTSVNTGTINPSVAPALIVSGMVCGGTPSGVSGGSLSIEENVAFSGGLHMGIALARVLQSPSVSSFNATWSFSGSSAAASSIVAFISLANDPPVVDAGPDQTISYLSGSASTVLAGSVSDDGLPDPPAAFTKVWTKQSGPGSVTFVDDTDLTSGVSFDAPGIYELELEADDGALTASDTVRITVTQQLNPCDGGGTVEIGADPADGAAMATSKTPEVWVVFHLESGDLPVSALPLPDPLTYHGGHKDPRLIDLGSVRLAVSDQFGGPQTSDHTVTVIDTDYRFRSKQTTETLEGRTYTVWMADDATRRAQGVARRCGHFVIHSVEPVGDMTYRVHGSDFIGSVLSRFHADKKLHDRALNRTLFPQLPLALDGKVQPGYYGWIGDDSLATLEVDPVLLDHTQGYGGILDGGIYTDWGWGTVGITGPSGITLGESAGGVYGAGDDAFVFVTAVVGGIETDPFPLTDAAGEQFSFSGSGKKLTLACPAVTGATAYRWYVTINAQWGHTATPRDAKVRRETVGNSTELTDAGNENVGPWPPPDGNWTGVAATGQGSFVVIARYPDGLTPRQTIAGQVKWGPWASRPSRIGWTSPVSLPDEYWVISVIGNTFVNKWVVANTETFLDLTLASAPDEVLNGTFVQEGAIPLYYAGDEVIAGSAYRIFLASLGVIRINALHGSDEATPASRVQLDASVYGTTFLVPGKTGWPFATLYRTLVDEVGEEQWFTLVYGLSGNAIVEAAVDGTVPLTANTCGFSEDSRGVDDDGDASPTIDALADQILHFLENFANPQDGLIWKSGPWKTPHTRNGVSVHRGSAFQTARDYAETVVSGGFKGAWGFAVNLDPFDLGTWLRAAAINHDWRWNTNKHGQFEPLMIDPDAAAAAAFSDGSVLGVAGANIPNHAVPVYVPSAARRVSEISYVYKKNYVAPVTKPTPAEDDLLPPKLSESVDWYSGTVLVRNDASQLAFGGGSGRRDVKPLEVQFAMHRTGTGPATIVERFLARWGFPPDVWRFPASLLGVDVKNGQVVTWTHHAGTGSAGAVARRLWLAASELNPNIEPGNPASLDVWLEGEDITDLT